MSDSEDDWETVETPAEAITILHTTVFEFTQVILKLCLEDEKKNPRKYANKTKPSVKINVITALLKIFSPERLMQHYVNYVLNWRKYIDNRDDKFFLENDHIYPGAPKEDIEFFRDLWRPKSSFHLNDLEKDSVYEYFDSMIHYCQTWKDMTGFVAKWETDGKDGKGWVKGKIGE
jgi:hypothetical protein